MTATKEHDRRLQHKQDRRTLRDKVIFLTLMKRRFRCLWCGKVFTEPDEVFGSRRRSSYRFREYLGQEALHQTVRRTVQVCLPQAKVVVDKFHLIRHINRAMDKVRSRLQGGGRRGKRRDLFRSKYTLLKGTERLADWEKRKLNQLFYCYLDLKRAWVLKESFKTWYREMDRMRAEDMLGLLEERIEGDSLPEFKELLHTPGNWREEILKYFDYRITSGFVEGKNNRIKTIKRMAYPSREGS